MSFTSLFEWIRALNRSQMLPNSLCLCRMWELVFQSLTPKILAKVMPEAQSNCNSFRLRIKLDKDSLILFAHTDSIASSPSSNDSLRDMSTSSTLSSLMLSAKCYGRHNSNLGQGRVNPSSSDGSQFTTKKSYSYLERLSEPCNRRCCIFPFPYPETE